MTGVQTCALPICFPVTIGRVKVKVRFVESGFERLARLTDILKGEVRDNSVSTVFNFGICDIAGYVNGVND